MKVNNKNVGDYVLLFITIVCWMGGGSLICYELICHDHWLAAFLLALCLFSGLKVKVGDNAIETTNDEEVSS